MRGARMSVVAPAWRGGGLNHPGLGIQVVQAVPQLLIMLQRRLKLCQHILQAGARRPPQLKGSGQLGGCRGRSGWVGGGQGQAQLVAAPSCVAGCQRQLRQVIREAADVAPAYRFQLRLEAAVEGGWAAAGRRRPAGRFGGFDRRCREVRAPEAANTQDAGLQLPR